jgi:hypothetical protein
MCEDMHLFGADYRELPQNGGEDDLKGLWERRRSAPVGKPGGAKGGRQLRARLPDGIADLKWSGGKAGT